jgi:uncharacterized protein (DUF2147 family)
MKRALLSLLTIVPIVAAVGVQPAVAADPAADGLWEQIDESTGQAEGWFRIAQKDGVYEGVLVKGFGKPGDDPATWRCAKCEGAEKNASVIGLTLIKGMKRNGLTYEDGTIMDPRDGSVYRALMKLSPDGKKLEVRGYLGIALFGRTQVWNRLPDNALDPAPANRRDAPKQAPRAGAAPAPASR